MDKILIMSSSKMQIYVEGIKTILESTGQSQVLHKIIEGNFNDKVIMIFQPTIILIILDDIVNQKLNYINTHIESNFPFLIIDLIKMENDKLKEILSFKRKMGVVSASMSSEQLLHYIEHLHHTNQNWILSHDIQERIINEFLNDSNPKTNKANYTDIELEIARLAKKGYSIVDMSKHLDLSPNTIATYRSKMLKKSGLKSMNQLIAQL